MVLQLSVEDTAPSFPSDHVQLDHRECSEWKTSITRIECDRLITYGYDQAELIGRVPFGDGIFLLLRGRLPEPHEGQMFNAMLIAAMDHGITPPSTVAARVAASGGATLPAAVAAGLLAIGPHHGGAITPAMTMLQNAVKRVRAGEDPQEVANEIVLDCRNRGERVPGLGHRWHDEDPRPLRLLALADELGIAGDHVAMERIIQQTASNIIGKPLSPNVDGGIAPIALDMGFDPQIGNAFFIIGRIGGLVAHVNEEQTCEKPMRRMWAMDYTYTGPTTRELPSPYKDPEHASDDPYENLP